MLSDFVPVPSIGSYYKFPDGKIIVVKYHVPEEPDIEECIGYAYTTNPDDVKEAILKEWNSWDLIPLSNDDLAGAEPSDNGDVDNSEEENGDHDEDSSPKDPTSEDSQPKGTDGEPHNKSRNSGLDPKLQELEDFLKKGPEINAQFFPFNHKVESNDVEENDIIEGYNRTLKEIDDLREDGKKRSNKWSVNEFLWTCGGLDKNLLRMFPTDWAKKAGLGGTILGTAVLATLSMGYAAFTVASIGVDEKSYIPYVAAGIIGIIWGLVIFNLDRYLVNSMYSDGESTISMREFKSGLPRIIIAIFLGIVISTPIEMKVFDGKINEYIINEDEGRMDDNSLLATSSELRELKVQLGKKEEETKQFKTQWLTKDSLYTIEHTKGQNGSKAGYGPKAKQLEKDAYEAKKIYEESKQVLDTLQYQYNKALGDVTTNQKSNIGLMQGFSRRIEALLKVTEFDGGKNPLYWIRLLIMLMFIILEVLPVFNKMMQEDGKYDKMIDLESDTMDKLARAKEANNINILRSGRLSRYKSYILGKKVKEFEDDNLEDNIGFTKKEPLREDKNTTDNNNQEIFNEAQALAKAYTINEMRKIFGDIPPIYSQPVVQAPANNASVDRDPSSEAKVI